MSTNDVTPRFDLYQTVTDRIVALLEQGIIPWRKPWSSAGPPMNAISKRAYQGINLWMLLCLPYQSNLFLTWEQLHKVNGSVLRGEKGHIVVYWQMPERTIDELASEEQTPVRTLLRYHKVFNVEQCQGINPSVLTSTFERQNDPIKACEIVIENFHDRPGISLGKDMAAYFHPEDLVYMPPMKAFDSSEAYYSTLFHELIHSTGHEKRLNRKTLTEMAEFGSEPYSIEELVAELGTCFLSSHTGILEKEFKNSAAYIQGWLAKLKNDKRFVMVASTQAQKASDYILSGRRKEQEEYAAEAAVSK